MNPNRIYFGFFGIIGLLFLFFRFPYRSYIYAHNVFDFYIADCAPNFLAVFLYIFLRRSSTNEDNPYLLVTMSGVALIIYELVQGKSILFYDPKDIVATLLAVFIAGVSIKWLDKTLGEQSSATKP